MLSFLGQYKYSATIIYNKYIIKCYDFSKDLAAFTLAEVLLTLMIIGVVAALVIPVLINDTRNAEYTTKLKKYNHVLNDALIRANLDNGGNIFYACKDQTPYTYDAVNCVANIFLPYLNVTKVSYAYNYPHTINFLSGGSNTPEPVAYIYLNDGVNIGFWMSSNAQYRVILDVNNYVRLPNTYGKDVFYFNISNNSNVLRPGDSITCGYPSSCTGSGTCCTGYYLLN